LKGGYDSIYLGLITKLSGCDFQEAADRLTQLAIDAKKPPQTLVDRQNEKAH
jgi:hypothetical protein